MITLDPAWTEDVMRIVIDCAEVQNSNASAHEKEKAKLKAYDEIQELILTEGDSENE